MRPGQKEKRALLEARYGRPDRRSIRVGTAELLRAIGRFLDPKLSRFVSDEHRAYPSAIRDAGLGQLPHLRVPGSAQRTAMNPLFEVNLADMSIRHGNSSQKRETIAFNKRRQAGLERAWLWAIWKNYMAPRRVKSNGASPAMLAGIRDQRLTFDEVFSKRIFPRDVALPDAWGRQAGRRVETPAVGRNRTHTAVYCT